MRPPVAVEKHRMLINGIRSDSSPQEWFESFDPFTAKPWALVARATPVDVELAIAAAKAAFARPWRKMTATARGLNLRRFAELVAEYLQEKSVRIDFSGSKPNPFVQR